MVCWTFPSILAFVLTFFCCCYGQPRYIVVAPNLIRTNTEENIFLQANGVSGGDIHVTIGIKRFRTGIQDFRTENPLSQYFVWLNQQNNFHTLVPIQVPSHHLNRDEKELQFVVLSVQFGDYHTEERVIMVSFQAGYIFIQTDKPIYKPEDNVRFRAFVSSPFFKASGTNAISVDIKNPDGVVVKQDYNKLPNNGIYTGAYTLPNIANEGKWTVIARFDHWPQNNFNATFEVKKYVLPAFNVTLTPSKPYLDVNDTQLEVNIRARYLFNEPVIGTAYVVYGLKKDQKMMRAPNVKQVEMLENGGTLIISMDEIQQACDVQSGSAQPDCTVSSLVDSYVYIKVSVLTDSGGDLVEAERSNIKIVQSPYVLTLSKMPKYFKPGLPFLFTIHVTYHDGTPANNIKLQVNLLDKPLTVSSGTERVSINMPNKVSPQTIHIATNQQDLSAERQAKKEVTVEPYRPANPNRPSYLYIHAGHHKVDTGSLSMELSIESANKNDLKEVTYLIVSKGKIMEAKRTAITSLISITTEVTSEMMPSFRFVAFYTIGTEVVSDSVKLEVSKTCVTTPVLMLPRDSAQPKSTLNFKIQGEPSSKVSLVAVDQAVYLLSKNRFNQRHILDEVESRDMACTYGSGKDAMGVFTDAGLLFAMKDGPATESRQELKCPDNARRRRSADLIEQKLQLVGEFQEKLLQRCCRDGLRGVLMPYSCEQRSLYITEGPECVKAFLKCCNIYKKKVNTQRQDDLELGRGTVSASGSSSDVSDPEDNEALNTLGEEEEVDINEISLRTQFYEAWLWKDVVLPAKADHDGKASIDVQDAVPDSITEWAVHAVSSSKKTGFCVAEPSTFVVKQNFFVDLKVPFSVARNEQVEIKAVVYNFMNIDLDVIVVLEKTRYMCSVAFKRQHTQKRKVRAGKSTVVPYTIVPLKEGKIPIVVAAYVKNRAEDRIEKILNVVMEGVQKTESHSIQLNPTDYRGEQIVPLSQPVLKGVVPKSEPITKIKLTGNILADSIDNAIRDDSLAALIQMPGGCVEQNLATMTFPIIATLYLDRTKGWMSVGVQRKIDALHYIKTGYSKQLQYKLSDGSYPRPQQERCKHMGALQGDDSAVTLTAFVIIAFAEVKQANLDCSYLVNSQPAIDKAVPYLKEALQRSPPPRPYTKAITSYALALLNDEIGFDPTTTLLAASSDGTFWPDADSLFQLEATGYALLALVKMGRLTEAKKPFDYLSSNRRIGSGFGNTQSTMVVLHALSEYLIAQPPPVKHSLDVSLQIAARTESLNFNSETSYQSRSFNVPKDADLEVVARGNGMGTVEVVTFYNQLPEEDAKSCKAFDLEVSIQKSKEKPLPGTVNVFDLTITVKALGPNPALSVVLDISLPTGTTPETRDLENLLNTVERYIDYFYFDDKLSDRSSLIIHMYKVSNTVSHIITFRLLQQFKAGLLQPSSVTVYEYYKEQAQRCTRLYTPPQDQAQLTTICQNYVCQCVQGDCCEVQSDTDDVDNDEREMFPCKTLHHVFKVKVLNVSSEYYDRYHVEITKVIKEGVEAGVLDSEQRFFYSHTGCRNKCQLQRDSQYLIMGPESDRWTIDTNTNKYMYVLGKDTWVERWPTPTECAEPDFEDTCRSLEALEKTLIKKGCKQ